jgi:S-adenosylmethionine:tRNA ribosyltransferase-isomerase
MLQPLLKLAPPPLPAELRATQPPEMRGVRRDHVRLMVVDRARRQISHSRFDRIGEFLGAGDLLVVNTSRTLPAALPATRADGSFVQVRPCVRRPGHWDALVVEPQPPFGNVVLREGETLRIGATMTARVAGRRPDIPLLWRLEVSSDGLAEMEALGEPIRYSYVPEPVALDFYQNAYAGRAGSAEMPSAGRPFSHELLGSLRRAGVSTAEILLHTGLSSFQDDAFDAEHHLYEEWFEIDAAAAAAVNAAPRVVAVGTTVVRAVESAAAADGSLRPAFDWTSLAISAGTPIRAVDALITGLHEPTASHLDLLRAFVDEALLMRAYEEAVEHRYLWHEFGDSMLIV